MKRSGKAKQDISRRSGHWPALMLTMVFAAITSSCASYQKPVTFNETAIHQRAEQIEANGLRVATALVSDSEALRLFGVDLSKKDIQALWLSVENESDRGFLLLPTSIDPEYYAPLEVAFAYHGTLSAKADKALDEHLLEVAFPYRGLIAPGKRVDGYLFTRRSRGAKAVDIDLLGDGVSENFTFFVLDPNAGSAEGSAFLNRMDVSLADADLQSVESESELRNALQQLPCCVSSEPDGEAGEPLNVVIIGKLSDWVTAFLRRGFRYHELQPRYAFGRSQDISARKMGSGYSTTQEQLVRIWQTPIRYQGKPVLLGQVSTRLGGRFSEEIASNGAEIIHPYVDESRDDLAQDLAYSQALVKIGHVKGAAAVATDPVGEDKAGNLTETDGLRVVLVFADRPISLGNIEFFDWERLADYR